MQTCQSESGKLKSIILKRPATAFISRQKIASEWHTLGYQAMPDFEASCKEYDRFEELIYDHDVEVYHLPEDPALSLDSIYCRDAAVVCDQGVILARMGKAARGNEPYALGELLNRKGIKVLGQIEGSGSLEGGDVAWLDTTTLVVGHSYRSNEEGIGQLESLLSSSGIMVIRVDLPHYRGPTDVFHLMSVFSPVAPDIAVVFSPLLPISFRNVLLDRQIRLVEVPENEMDTLGCNVLALKPGVCMMVEGNPVTRAGLEKAGCQVISFSGREICLKGSGGPTCLTRPLFRII